MATVKYGQSKTKAVCILSSEEHAEEITKAFLPSLQMDPGPSFPITRHWRAVLVSTTTQEERENLDWAINEHIKQDEDRVYVEIINLPKTVDLFSDIPSNCWTFGREDLTNDRTIAGILMESKRRQRTGLSSHPQSSRSHCSMPANDGG